MATSIQLAAALALTLLPTACSSASGSAGAGPATARVAAERQVLPVEDMETTSTAEAPRGAVGARRQPVTTPLTALSQLVTTQALLVSLLLAPVSPGAGAASRPEPTPRSSGPARSH